MIFNSKKVIFPRKGVSEKTRAIKKNNLIYIYISSKISSSNNWIEALIHLFSVSWKFLFLSFFRSPSLPLPFFFKIRANMLQFVVVNWRRPRVIVNRLCTHASRNLSPPLCVLQSPATRNRSWLAEQRSRITSPSFFSGSLLSENQNQKKTRLFPR